MNLNHLAWIESGDSLLVGRWISVHVR